MHGRDWYSYVALGIVVGIGLSLILLNFLHLSHGYYNHADRDYYAEPESSLEPNQVGTWTFRADGHAELKCPADPKSEKYYECHDLNAQQSMALSTAEMEGWARVSSIIAGLGVVLLVWTLFETRKSTELQLRAYISVDSVVASFADSKEYPSAGIYTVEFDIVAKNTGQTPALNVRTWTVVALEPPPFNEEWLNDPRKRGSRSDIGAGADIRISQASGQPGVPLVQHKISEGELGCWLYGFIEYEDIFGHTHLTQYRYVLVKTAAGAFMSYPTETGNRLT